MRRECAQEASRIVATTSRIKLLTIALILLASAMIKDKLALRATAYRFEDSGIYRNIAGSDPTFLTTVAGAYGAEAIALASGEVDVHVRPEASRWPVDRVARPGVPGRRTSASGWVSRAAAR